MTALITAVCFRHKHLLPCRDCAVRKHARVIWDARIAAREAAAIKDALERHEPRK